jgi:uncharacterized protein (DUF302 family)
MKTFLLSCLIFASTAFGADGFVLLQTAKSGKELTTAVSAAVTNAGFALADERDLSDAFQKQFGESQYSQYYNITALDSKTLSTLLPKHPKLAGFVPYTVLIYQKKGESNSYIGFVKTEAIILSTGINDKAVIKALKESEQRLEKALKDAIKDAKPVKIPYKSLMSADKELFFDVAIPAGDNALSKKEELQQEFESALEVEGFKISNITDVISEFEKVNVAMDEYEFFETYSICKLKVIYNASKERPETGVFAPCSVYFYKLKNESVIRIGFPPTKNWVVHTNITNPEHIQIMKDAENIAKTMLQEASE